MSDRRSWVGPSAHNPFPKLQEIDVHRLKVPEAVLEVKRALKEALEKGASELRIITGRGNHSQDKLPILRPAVQQELQR